MDQERWRKARELFQRASDLPAEERDAFIRVIEDAGIRADVAQLLAAGDLESDLARAGDDPQTRPIEPVVATADLKGIALDDYELMDVIGRGGMGVVYRARQLSLGRIVAVKVLALNHETSPRTLERFKREAQSVARLHHPGIVGIHSVGERDDLHYFTMEYVDGDDLAVEIARMRGDIGISRRRESVLPDFGAHGYFAVVARMIKEASDALQHAHDHGVVHRDVKPSNLLVDARGAIRVVDFGIARTEELGSLTRTNEMAGSPHYMSPEQVEASATAVDHRTDVYSLGVVLYELLTLCRPFDGPNINAVFKRIQLDEPVAIRKLNEAVPVDLAIIAQTAMNKRIRSRYKSVGDLRDDLRRFLEHRAIEARAPSARQKLTRWANRHRSALITTGALVLATCCGVIYEEFQDEYARRRMDITQLTDYMGGGKGDLELLATAREAASRLRGSWGRLGKAERETVMNVEKAIGQELFLERTQAREWIAKSRQPTGREAEQDWLLLRGLFLARDLQRVFPDDPELKELAAIEASYPKLSVRASDALGRAAPASVYRRAIDPADGSIGPELKIGETPLEHAPIPPGFQRIVVDLGDGRFREMTRYFYRAMRDTAFEVSLRADEDAIDADMARFRGDAFRIDLDRVRTVDPYYDVTLTVEPFAIDRTEVSNRQYHEFLLATGRARDKWPRVWGGSFPDKHADLPVTDVSWDDAAEYALWAGKRLPTYGEWVYAARGPEGRWFPYAAERSAAPASNGNGEPLKSTDELEATRAKYLRHAAPVRSFEGSRTPQGLYHMLGNVKEITESAMVKIVRGHRDVFPFDRIDAGADWSAHQQGRDLSFFGFSGLDEGYSRPDRGFRCARTVRR